MLPLTLIYPVWMMSVKNNCDHFPFVTACRRQIPQ